MRLPNQSFQWRILTVAVVLAWGCAPAIDLHNKPGTLKVGAGRATIQEPVGTPTAGYAQSPYLGSPLPTDEPGSPYADMFPATRGMQSAPSAKAIVLDNGVTRMVLAKIDAVGVTDILTERVIQLAQKNLNLDIEGKLILNGTHTHDAACRFGRTSVKVDLFLTDFPLEDPRSNALAHGFDTYSQDITDRVAGGVVDAIKEALDGLRPAKFGYAEGINQLAGHDRRSENNHLPGYGYCWTDTGGNAHCLGYHDPRVRVVRIDDAQTGDPIAVLTNFAMHGTIYDSGNHNLSVDAPGHAEYFIEQQFDKPVVAMYLQGNAADVGPSYGNNDRSEAMQYAGWQLAQTVKQVYDTIQPAEQVVPLQVKERWTAISYNILGYPPQNTPGYFYPDGAGLCFQLFGNFLQPPQGIGQTHSPADITDPTQQICFTTVLPGEGKYSTRFAAARIGDLALLAVPGEPSTKVGELIETGVLAANPDIKEALVLGYSQDHNGYILMDDDWLSGGYNPTITFWGWRFGSYTVQQTKDVFQELMTGKASYANIAKGSQIPNMQPDDTPPVVPTNSMRTPAVDQDVPASAERLQTIDFSWYGGDPGLNHPVVTLQVKNADGTFSDVTQPTPGCGLAPNCWTSGWIPVNDLSGFDFAILYTATPTYKANPTATVRDHHWSGQYEPPINLPPGTYRFHITGQAKQNDAATAYDLTTGNVQVGPSTQLGVDATLTESGDVLSFDGTLLYPQHEPSCYSPQTETVLCNTNNAPDWQTRYFRAAVPRWGTYFAPAVPASDISPATLVSTGAPVDLTYVERAFPDELADYWRSPTTGSSLHGEATVSSSADQAITIPVLTDQFSNTAAARTIAVINLANVTTPGSILTFTPGFAGHVAGVSVLTSSAPTTAGKAFDLGVSIEGTPVTGGVVPLTSAATAAVDFSRWAFDITQCDWNAIFAPGTSTNCHYGANVGGTAVTDANAFSATDTLALTASDPAAGGSLTPFTEGQVYVTVTYAP
jgi:hypothetical protein